MKVVLSLLVLSLVGSASISEHDRSLVGAESTPVTSWRVDKAHSSIGFTVTHFFTPVRGQFKEFEIEILFDPDSLDKSRISATIDVSSVDTGNERRDDDLRSDSFFDVDNYPTMTFASETIEATGENTFVAHGKLKIRDVEKDFDLPFTLLGIMELPPERAERMRTTAVAGFSAEASLNRNEFGVGSGNWVATTVVGGTVGVSINLEVRRNDS